MDLHIIHVLQFYSVLLRNPAGIARQNREIRGVLIQTADAACRHDRILRMDVQRLAVPCLRDHAAAVIIHDENICHYSIFHDGHIRQFFHMRKQRRGDLLAGDILMETDSRSGMCSLSRVGKRAIRILRKTNPEGKQIIDDRPASADHEIHALLPVLIMSRPHGILKIGIIIVLIMQHTDASLCQHGITALQIFFGQHQNLLVSSKTQRRIQPCHSAACNHYVIVHISHLIYSLFSYPGI